MPTRRTLQQLRNERPAVSLEQPADPHTLQMKFRGRPVHTHDPTLIAIIRHLVHELDAATTSLACTLRMCATCPLSPCVKELATLQEENPPPPTN